MVSSKFSLATGSQIKWNKFYAIWVSHTQRTFEWGVNERLCWLLPGEMTRYLEFMVGFQVTMEAYFEAALKTLKRKLAYWSTTKLSPASRVLIANQVLLASLWFIASCWSPHLRSVHKVKSLIRNYIWSGKNGERACRAKVAWNSLILPHKLGGLK